MVVFGECENLGVFVFLGEIRNDRNICFIKSVNVLIVIVYVK